MKTVEHRVLYGDTDAGAVVYYANYLRWFESGRRELIRSLGIDLLRLEHSGIIVPVVEVNCKYFAPARYDDIIIVETKIGDIKEKAVKFAYRILRKHDKKLLAEGHTVNVFVDAKKMKSVKIPPGSAKKLRLG